MSTLLIALSLAQSKSVIKVPVLVEAPKSFLKAPNGYKVTLFADDLKQVRMMAVAPNGDVFAVQTRIEKKGATHPHQVTVVWDSDRDGFADQHEIWSDHLDLPFGIQFGYGHVYVANTGSVVRWPYKLGQRAALDAPETVISGIPDLGYRNHWTRNIYIDGVRKLLYLTIGSKENVAVEPGNRGVIQKFNMDDKGLVVGKHSTLASGMRNPIGLDLNPFTRDLYANVVERDYLGDHMPDDFTTKVVPGGFYGWPYFYDVKKVDRRVPRRPDLEKKVLRPTFLLDAHSSPIDIKFAKGGAMSAFNGDAFVALHGSQNRSVLNGYKVVRLRFKDGRPTGESVDFVTGWKPSKDGVKIYGRPAGLAIMPDGSLLIADDWGGKIWRVSRA